MITPSERKILKKLIGFRHIAQISKYLQEKGITNRYGEHYSSVFISGVFNGAENEKIEEAIMALAAEKKKEKEAASESRRQFFNEIAEDQNKL